MSFGVRPQGTGIPPRANVLADTRRAVGAGYRRSGDGGQRDGGPANGAADSDRLHPGGHSLPEMVAGDAKDKKVVVVALSVRNARWPNCTGRGWPCSRPNTRAKVSRSWRSIRTCRTRSPRSPPTCGTRESFPSCARPKTRSPHNSGPRTPEVFVLDQARVVRYQGRIDDQYGVGFARKTPAQ